MKLHLFSRFTFFALTMILTLVACCLALYQPG